MKKLTIEQQTVFDYIEITSKYGVASRSRIARHLRTSPDEAERVIVRLRKMGLIVYGDRKTGWYVANQEAPIECVAREFNHQRRRVR